MKTKVLIIECGKGFGGALTSIDTFLKNIQDQQDFEFYFLSNYTQGLIKPGGAIKKTNVLKRWKLYGPASKTEQWLGKVFKKNAGHIAFMLDAMSSGLFYTIRVWGYIAANGIDIIHLNNSILINDCGILAAYLSRKKTLVQVRAPEYPSKIARFFAQMVHGFLPVSKFVKDSLTTIGVKDDIITIVPEGIDAEQFKARSMHAVPKSLIKKDGVPLIGMVGCLVPWKGHKVFLDACRMVLKKCCAIFCIVGDTPDGSPEYKAELENYAEELKINQNVIFTGHCDNVAPIVRACDILVHASTSPEPFGRVIIEAMSLGKPVIATGIGGPAEVIDSGIDGLLVKPGNANEMTEAVLDLIENKNQRVAMGNAAKEKTNRDYTASIHTRIILNCYKKLAERQE